MKATCPYPLVLKNGYVVPCGKCEICRSNRRNEWSIRVQLQCKYVDKMPLMIGLDYAPEWLPKDGNNNPKLLRDDVSAFLKAYKRKYHLSNAKFVYFGCGEYGGLRGRPHYHLVFFGDDDLYNLYCVDDQLARNRLQPLWKYGRVWIGFAEWSGIHYVTKYVLKDDESNFNRSVPSFTIVSKGLGMSFLDSYEATEIRKKLQYLKYNFNYIHSHCPDYDPQDVDLIKAALAYYRPFVPNWKVQLESGKWVLLPRVIRKKFLGTFEDWKFNPLWEYNLLEELLKMHEYLKLYDGTNFAAENAEKTINVIRNRLIKLSHDKNFKKLSRL